MQNNEFVKAYQVCWITPVSLPGDETVEIPRPFFLDFNRDNRRYHLTLPIYVSNDPHSCRVMYTRYAHILGRENLYIREVPKR